MARLLIGRQTVSYYVGALVAINIIPVVFICNIRTREGLQYIGSSIKYIYMYTQCKMEYDVVTTDLMLFD